MGAMKAKKNKKPDEELLEGLPPNCAVVNGKGFVLDGFAGFDIGQGENKEPVIAIKFLCQDSAKLSGILGYLAAETEKGWENRDSGD
jgi:hypothetical protein